MQLGYRRVPSLADGFCPVCTGLLPAQGTALALDMLAPGERPRTLALIHAPCLHALSATAEAIIALRETPRGPTVDDSGAVIVVHEGVRFRVTGSRRSQVADAVREAIATAKHGRTREPIVAFVRRTVTASPAGKLIRRVDETPGAPPSVRGPGDPAMIVSFETGEPSRHEALLNLFSFVPADGIRSIDPAYIDLVGEIVAFIRNRADSMAGEAGAPFTDESIALHCSEAIEQLARVTSVTALRDGRYCVVLNPRVPAQRPAPGVQAGAFVNTPPPSATFGQRSTGRSVASSPLSPDGLPANGRQSSTPAPSGSTASGGPLPPPGEVTHPMLDPLDTPESIAARATIEASLYTGLTRAFPKLGITAVAYSRDADTFAECITVTVRQRVQTESEARMADMLMGRLRSKVTGWADLEAAGLSLIVRAESPPPRDGVEAGDEVSLRSLPPCPRSVGTTSAIGKAVAFRAPLWKAIFDAADKGMYAEQLGPYEPELARIRKKLLKLLAGQDPEAARVGTLVGYDAITDHACVEVKLASGSVFLHSGLSWTMEWNVPAAPAAPSWDPDWNVRQP